jgi:hypothetical protein
MKKAYLSILFLFVCFIKVHADTPLDANQDTARVNLLIKQGYLSRLTDHDQTIKKGQQALELAQKLNYVNGIAESYRILGIGEYYANHEAKALVTTYILCLTIKSIKM